MDEQMDVNMKRSLLFEEVTHNIKYWSQVAVDRLIGKEDSSGIPQAVQYGILKERLHTEEDLSAFHEVVQDICHGMMFSFLCVFDGVETGINEHLTPAIIDPETSEDLAPVDSTYHDEFNYYYFTHK